MILKLDSFTKYIKRKVISSPKYWKIRHFIEPSWVSAYEHKKTNEFYFDYLKKSSFNSLLDFGCATGKTMYDLKLKFPDLLSYGIEINENALSRAEHIFSNIDNTGRSFSFQSKLNESDIKIFLKTHSLKRFDLAIFDRVLYCLSDKEINDIFLIVTKFVNEVFIDDFMYDQSFKGIGYKHRKWNEIFAKFDFKCSINIPSIYSEVEGANPRSMTFIRDDV